MRGEQAASERNTSSVLNVFIAPSLLLIFSLVLSNAVPAQAVAGQGPFAQSPSIVEIPIRISLGHLFEVAEQEMPLQAGSWRDWKKIYGIRTKYRAWRGPLYFTMQGDVLLVQAHVRYWIKAHKKVLGALNLKSSCGVNEAPRQAVIGIQIRLGWEPDWMLRPEFRVMPTRFPDRCEMTIADIDVTPIIEREFQKQLQNKMRAALMMLAPRLNEIRQQAEQIWFLLQEPVQLWGGQWLLLSPREIALSPLAGHGDSVDAHLAMTMDLDYVDLNRAITERLAGESISIGGHKAGIEMIELGGQGQEILVNTTLSGYAAGKVVIKAKMIFSPEKQQFQLEDLDYTYTPQDPLLEPEAKLFSGIIRKVLEAAVNQQLQQRMNQWKERLLTVFNNITPDNVNLDMASLQLRQVQLNIIDDAIRLNGQASGQIMLEFR